MVSFGIRSGNYQLTASSTKRITTGSYYDRYGNRRYYYYYYEPSYGRLHGSSAWMPYSTGFGEYLQVSK